MNVLLLFSPILIVMSIAIIGSAIDHFSHMKCPHCGSRSQGCDHSRSRYARGWNYLCNQASGGAATWCGTHMKLFYDETADEHLKHTPYWCTDELGRMGLAQREHVSPEILEMYATKIAAQKG